MLKSRQLLGREQWEVCGYLVKLSLDWDDGAYDLHTNYKLLSDGNVGTETIIEKRRIKTEYIYSGDPSLLDRFLGRAEKEAVGTNAESFVRDSLEKAKRRIRKIEEGRGKEFDEEAFDTEIEEKVFPLSEWADIEDSALEVGP